MHFSWSNGLRTELRDALAFAAPIAERSGGEGKLPRRPRLVADLGHAVDVGQDQSIWTFDMHEDLTRCGLAAGSLNDPRLIVLHEVAVLHDLIEPFDLEGGVEQTVPSRWIERNTVVQVVDKQVSNVSDPVGHLGAEQTPEGEIADMIGAAEADALELHNAGIARRKVAAAAARGSDHEIDAVT